MLLSILAPYAAARRVTPQPSANPDTQAQGATEYRRVRQVAPAASRSEIQGAAPHAQAVAQWTALLDQIQRTWEREHKSSAIPTEFDPAAQEIYDPAADRERDRALMALVESSDSEGDVGPSGPNPDTNTDSDSEFEVGPAGPDLLLTESSDDEEPNEEPNEEPLPDPPRAYPSGGPKAGG